MKNIETVIKAREMGFCLGVRRAVGTLDQAVLHSKSRVYTLGPIIHNPQVLEGFVSRGVVIAEKPEDIPEGATAVIRAHGVPPALLRQLKEKHLAIENGTCPKVISSQKTVKKYNSLGYNIIIVGDADHGEIKGLAGYADSPCLISTPEDARRMNLKGKSLVIGQTTIKQDEFDTICDILKSRTESLKIVNSICSATKDRQDALIELCNRVDACLIIGGKNSANTQRLYFTARETGIPAWHIEGVEDIPEEIGDYRIIGISAGASTPDSVIDQVEQTLLAE